MRAGGTGRERLVVAIDGPAGAGKSTIAREVARELGYTYLDTGAMYRSVGLLAREAGIPLDDEVGLAELVSGLRFSFPWQGEELRTRVGNRDLSEAIRTPRASMDASTVSKVAVVRDALVALQREMARDGGVVMEGRDIGTVVFPDAELKVFLTASARVRGRRRYLQLHEGGDGPPLDVIIEDIERRDHQDSTREIAPLRPAEDAVIIDSSELGIERVRGIVLKLAAARQGAGEAHGEKSEA